MNRRNFVAVIAISMAFSSCGAQPGVPAGEAESDGFTLTNAAEPGEVTTTSDAPAQREPVTDGKLDCAAGGNWSMQASVTADATGAATPEEEISGFLAAWSERFGGDIVHIRKGVGALVLDGSEVVVAIATPAPAGGWIVLTTVGCEGFQV